MKTYTFKIKLSETELSHLFSFIHEEAINAADSELGSAIDKLDEVLYKIFKEQVNKG